MPIIYFVRHGETDWNAERRLQGQRDTDLNDTGRGQAARNGQVLSERIGDPQAFDFVASPLRRTRETMEIVRRELGLATEGYRTDGRLREIHFGDWEGLTWAELKARDPEAHTARRADPWSTAAPGHDGESYAELSQRALEWFHEVERDTVVVSHGGVLRCLRGHVERMPQAEIPSSDALQDRFLLIDGAATLWI